MDPNKRIEAAARIREVRRSVEELEQQLENSQDAERVQRELMDNIEEYINAVDTKISSLKIFWQALKEDLRPK